jgi:hypothetical protein
MFFPKKTDECRRNVSKTRHSGPSAAKSLYGIRAAVPGNWCRYDRKILPFFSTDASQRSSFLLRRLPIDTAKLTFDINGLDIASSASRTVYTIFLSVCYTRCEDKL